MFIEYEPPPEIYRGSSGLLYERRDIAQFPNQDILSDRQKGKGLRFGLPISKVGDIITSNLKLPGHGPKLPGKVISFHIVPLDPTTTAGLTEYVTLFLAMPISWRGTLQQYVGRLHRFHDNKRVVQVYDYVDIHVPTLMRMYKKRVKDYEAIGYSMQNDPEV